MPGFGLIPARGTPETRWFPVASTATFAKGAAVNFTPSLTVREYLSTDSSVLGVALSASTNSRLVNGVLSVAVSLPLPGCTYWSDLTTGVVQSALSPGFHSCLYKQGNLMSYASTVIGHASLFSALVTVVGLIDSVRSRVEVAFNMSNVGYYSNSSQTYAT